MSINKAYTSIFQALQARQRRPRAVWFRRLGGLVFTGFGPSPLEDWENQELNDLTNATTKTNSFCTMKQFKQDYRMGGIKSMPPFQTKHDVTRLMKERFAGIFRRGTRWQQAHQGQVVGVQQPVRQEINHLQTTPCVFQNQKYSQGIVQKSTLWRYPWRRNAINQQYYQDIVQKSTRWRHPWRRNAIVSRTTPQKGTEITITGLQRQLDIVRGRDAIVHASTRWQDKENTVESLLLNKTC